MSNNIDIQRDTYTKKNTDMVKYITFKNPVNDFMSKNLGTEYEKCNIKTSKSYLDDQQHNNKQKMFTSTWTAKSKPSIEQPLSKFINELQQENKALKTKNEYLEKIVQQQDFINQKNKIFIQNLLKIIEQKSNIIGALSGQNGSQDQQYKRDMYQIQEYVKHYLIERNMDINMSTNSQEEMHYFSDCSDRNVEQQPQQPSQSSKLIFSQLTQHNSKCISVTQQESNKLQYFQNIFQFLDNLHDRITDINNTIQRSEIYFNNINTQMNNINSLIADAQVDLNQINNYNLDLEFNQCINTMTNRFDEYVALQELQYQQQNLKNAQQINLYYQSELDRKRREHDMQIEQDISEIKFFSQQLNKSYRMFFDNGNYKKTRFALILQEIDYELKRLGDADLQIYELIQKQQIMQKMERDTYQRQQNELRELYKRQLDRILQYVHQIIQQKDDHIDKLKEDIQKLKQRLDNEVQIHLNEIKLLNSELLKQTQVIQGLQNAFQEKNIDLIRNNASQNQEIKHLKQQVQKLEFTQSITTSLNTSSLIAQKDTCLQESKMLGLLEDKNQLLNKILTNTEKYFNIYSKNETIQHLHSYITGLEQLIMGNDGFLNESITLLTQNHAILLQNLTDLQTKVVNNRKNVNFDETLQTMIQLCSQLLSDAQKIHQTENKNINTILQLTSSSLLYLKGYLNNTMEQQ